MPAFSGEIIRVDLNDPLHAAALVQLLDQYARDPMGGEAPLSPDVHQNLIERLRKVDQFRGLLAKLDGQFVGLANCFLGFSTFKAQPLMNIHDLAVAPMARGQGVGGALLQAVDQLAKEEACAYVTLEVRADNRARQLYLRHGFVAGDPTTDAMSFLKKAIDI